MQYKSARERDDIAGARPPAHGGRDRGRDHDRDRYVIAWAYGLALSEARRYGGTACKGGL
jgi:hypothetical protein